MMYDLGIDLITKTKIFVFASTNSCNMTSYYLSRYSPKTLSDLEYYKNNGGKWIFQYNSKAKRYRTLIEVKTDYKNYLTFLKECGYDV